VVSRVVDRRFVFGEVERGKFRELMVRLLGYCGLECVTFCLMSNHFHLLVVVPEGARELTDEGLLGRMACLYDPVEVGMFAEELGRLRREDPAGAERLVAGHTRRMGDLSEFVRELKVRFSRWYNRREGRRGTLWEERFRSVLVEDGRAVETVAAYIDLNPVRAGLVVDPKDFRWSGYGEAVAGVKFAREGIRRAVDPDRSGWGWDEVQAAYRRLVYGMGGQGEAGSGEPVPKRRGIPLDEVDAVLRKGGKLSLPELLRCRVRYFCDGAALGRRGFLEGVFGRHRERFGGARRTGARPMRSGDWGGLMVLRALRNPVAAPAGGAVPGATKASSRR
jgi:REP element-mobilizing transposase RayT